MRLKYLNAFRGVGVLLACWISSQTAVGSTLSGQVRLAAPPNDPVPDARVTLFTPSMTFFAETRSDAAGAYSIEGVPAGTYQLGCAALGFDYLEASITLGAGAQQRDFDLDPESHPGQWDVIGSTAPEFLDATDIAVLLPDGSVYYCHDTTDPILFDPVTGTKSLPSGSPSESGCMNSSLLADGSVIMVGGQDGSDPGSFVNASTVSPAPIPLAATVTLVVAIYGILTKAREGVDGSTSPRAGWNGPIVISSAMLRPTTLPKASTVSEKFSGYGFCPTSSILCWKTGYPLPIRLLVTFKRKSSFA
ncbi:MAG: carboxypeptidase regulatory-like domain-containing protein [Planctomycetes bacterium]|nr:carboxypeptidase regulatory-like domain-containing protein [Planctomycetota bacterium]